MAWVRYYMVLRFATSIFIDIFALTHDYRIAPKGTTFHRILFSVYSRILLATNAPCLRIVRKTSNVTQCLVRLTLSNLLTTGKGTHP